MNINTKKIIVFSVSTYLFSLCNFAYAALNVTDHVTLDNVSNEAYKSIVVRYNVMRDIINEIDGVVVYRYGTKGNLGINLTEDSIIDVYHERTDRDTDVHAHGIYSYGDTSSVTISATPNSILNLQVTSINGNTDHPLTGTEKYASAIGISSTAGSAITIDPNINLTVLADAKGVETSAKSIGVATYSLDTEPGATIKFNGNVVMNIVAVVEDSGSHAHEDHDNSVGYAHGVHSNAANTKVIFKKNVDIKAFVPPINQEKDNSTTTAYVFYSSYRATNSNIYVNVNDSNPKESLGNIVKLQGDIVANNGNIYISLDNVKSYLYGTILQRKYDELSATVTDGRVNLSLDNGAQWLLTVNSYNNPNSPITTLPNGIIQLHNLQVSNGSLVDLTADNLMRQTDWRTLTFDTRPEAAGNDSSFSINGNNNTFVLNSDIANNNADKLVISSNNGANYIKINYDPVYANGSQATETTKTLVVQSVGTGDFSGNFTGVSHDNGIYQWTPTIKKGSELNNPVLGEENNWYIVGEHNAQSNIVIGNTHMTNTMLSVLRLTNQNLIRRIGELRDNTQSAGTWLRYYTGESRLLDGIGSQRYHAIQGGFDRAKSKPDGSKTFTGIALETLVANSSFGEGSGRTTALDIALYQAWVGNKGHYYDLVGKVYKLSNKMDIVDTEHNLIRGNYSTLATELSLEYGYRQELGSVCYITPQAQLIYRRIGSTNYATSNNVLFKQNSINSLIGRLGFKLGKKFDNRSQIFLETNILREFMGTANIEASDNYNNTLTTKMPTSELWYNIALGATLKLSNKTDLYMLTEKDFKSKYANAWQAQLGIRHSF